MKHKHANRNVGLREQKKSKHLAQEQNTPTPVYKRSKSGTKKLNHHTLSLPFPTPAAPPSAALGAGGMPVSRLPLPLPDVEDGVAVEPATTALLASGEDEAVGVGRDIGGSEERDAEGLNEKGGYVGNAVALVLVSGAGVESVVSSEAGDADGGWEAEDEADGGTNTVVVTVLSVEDVAADEVAGERPTVVVVVLNTVDAT